ncbi:hypothetical protein EV356DRAFT_519531 [Viridothelium virens]|uniref:Zn(2)-C6 fungal-type domain-containing protein n=1 Tax=Viridothelium virens TaxID=1048519 RepID=A0A6A6GYI3_VIRVR|nr:hypothetical protein EV356DRAFT_519531 [Viridothelium virens]
MYFPFNFQSVSLLLLCLQIATAAKVSTISLYEEATPGSKDINFLSFDKQWTNKVISRWQYEPTVGENPHGRYQLKPKCKTELFVLSAINITYAEELLKSRNPLKWHNVEYPHKYRYRWYGFTVSKSRRGTVRRTELIMMGQEPIYGLSTEAYDGPDITAQNFASELKNEYKDDPYEDYFTVTSKNNAGNQPDTKQSNQGNATAEEVSETAGGTSCMLNPSDQDLGFYDIDNLPGVLHICIVIPSLMVSGSPHANLCPIPVDTPSRTLYPIGIIAPPVSLMSSEPSGSQGATSPATVDQSKSRRVAATPSCHLCRKRKVKCDRGYPCLSCQRAGAECIYSPPSRLPRGRQGGRRRKDSELLQRIAKLETLVKDLEGDEPTEKASSSKPQNTNHKSSARLSVSSSDSPPLHPPIDHITSQTAPPKGDTGAPFWIALSDEINGLRYLLGNQSLDDSDDDEDAEAEHETISSDSLSHTHSEESAWVLCGPEGLVVTEGALQYPPRAQVIELCEVYLTNAHPVYNILHGPSLKRFLRGESLTLDCSPGIKGLDALKFAVFHIAAASLTDTECMQRIGAPRPQLLANFRRCIEVALVRADFMNTVDLSTLQALVLFIRKSLELTSIAKGSTRSYDQSRFSWTLAGIAVRIGHALGLHDNGCYAGFPLFQAEMRRRLWWNLSVVDVSLAMDRGSEPVIFRGSFNTQLPLHINDEDIWLGGPEIVPERKEFTDMTFSLISQELCQTYRSIMFVQPSDPSEPDVKPERTWEGRKELVRNAQQRLEQRYLQYCDTSKPLEWTTKLVANVVMAILWLGIYRPLVQETIVVPPTDRPNVLVLSVEILEKHAVFATSPVTQQIKWLTANYVQWHTLAITLAELCVQTEGPLVERAWKIVDRYFDWVARDIADSIRGMRWQPIRKLMIKARKARQQAREPPQTPAVQATPTPSSFDFNQLGPLPSSPPEAEMENFQIPVTPAYTQRMDDAPQLPTTVTLPQDAFNWDPWLLANTETSIPYNAVAAWRNWENFIGDVQGENMMPGFEYGMPQGYNPEPYQ